MEGRYILPKGTPPPPSTERSRSSKTRISRSCVVCRQKRIRCDGGRPVCSNCEKLRKTQCDYSGVDERKRDHWKARVDALEQRNQYLERLVLDLSFNKPLAEINLVPQAHASNIEEHGRLTNKEEIGDVIKVILTFYNATAGHPALSELPTFSAYKQNSGVVDLPPRHFAESAMHALFYCAATLFYITTPEEADKLLDRVYSQQEPSSDDLCELCALAAIGSHYETNQIPDTVRATFFYLATASLEKLGRTSELQGMRVFICLCIASIMDKATSARLLIMSGLNIARRKLNDSLQHSLQDQHWVTEYARTYQTVIFLEAWLSYSLGYRSGIHSAEINLIRVLEHPDQLGLNEACLITRRIQSNMVRLSLIASHVYADLSIDGHSSWEYIETYSEQLNVWHRLLPDQLHLSILSKAEETNITPLHMRALYLMHILFMDTNLLLFCRVIKSQWRTIRTEDIQNCVKKLLENMPDSVRDGYFSYAVQLAKTVSLLRQCECLMPRCWVAIQATFDAGIMLLLHICQTHYTSNDAEKTQQSFENARVCINILEFCGSRDLAAHRLFTTIRCQYDDLAALLLDRRPEEEPAEVERARASQASMRIGYLMESDAMRATNLDEVTYRLLDLLVPDSQQTWV